MSDLGDSGDLRGMSDNLSDLGEMDDLPSTTGLEIRSLEIYFSVEFYDE